MTEQSTQSRSTISSIRKAGDVLNRGLLAWAWVSRKCSKWLWLMLIVFIAWISYWAIVGFKLDHSIQTYIAQCEDRLPDPTQERCVVAFIPVPIQPSQTP